MKRFRFKIGQKGQTMVEYILLIAVIMVIMSSIFKRLDELLISNPDSLQNQYLKGYENVFSAGEGGLDGQYRRFRVLK